MTIDPNLPIKDFYLEYQNLGGKKDFEGYSQNIDVFIEHTIDIFVFGDLKKYSSKQESLQGVMNILKIDAKEVSRLFQSIDRVEAYT